MAIKNSALEVKLGRFKLLLQKFDRLLQEKQIDTSFLEHSYRKGAELFVKTLKANGIDLDVEQVDMVKRILWVRQETLKTIRKKDFSKADVKKIMVAMGVENLPKETIDGLIAKTRGVIKVEANALKKEEKGEQANKELLDELRGVWGELYGAAGAEMPVDLLGAGVVYKDDSGIVSSAFAVLILVVGILCLAKWTEDVEHESIVVQVCFSLGTATCLVALGVASYIAMALAPSALERDVSARRIKIKLLTHMAELLEELSVKKTGSV